MGPARTAALLLVVLALAGCADPPAAGGPVPREARTPAADLPSDPGALVLRVEYVGGFVTPETTLTRLPMYSLYADGRLITAGPVPAIHPGPALPNLQIQTLDPSTVQELAGRALVAGVADTVDLGSPNLADVPSTRFTLTTADETHVREVYALGDQGLGQEQVDDGLTDEQRAGRAALRELVAALDGLRQQQSESYSATSVAALARPWTAPQDPLDQGLAPATPAPWPGPPLPGEPAGVQDLGCVTATGEEAAAVLAAATGATSLTSWATSDGALWSVAFRPLLPDESGCADLLG